MLLNIVTDEELLASQIVKSILLLVGSAGIFYNGILLAVKKVTGKKQVISALILVLLGTAVTLVVREFRIEYALMKHPVYVNGVTKGYCNIPARGEGIQFEYSLDGILFSNCNTFHPFSRDSILVPGGKYRIRCSREFPGSGRIDLRMKSE